MSDPQHSAAHVRIDEGVKRGPRNQIDRRPKAANAQDRKGQIVSTISPELKATIIRECHELMATGKTPAEIAISHNVSPRTVQYWLLGDETAEAARGQLIASELARTLDDMREPPEGTPDSPLRLARAREEFRAWSWIAERRESRLYGQKQEVSVKTESLSERDAGLLTSAQELLTLFKARQAQAVDNPVIEAHPPALTSK